MAKQRYIVIIRDDVQDKPKYEAFTVLQTNLSQNDAEHVACAVAHYIPGLEAKRVLSSHCEAVALIATSERKVNWQDVLRSVASSVCDLEGSIIKVKNSDKMPVAVRPGELGYASLSIKTIATTQEAV